MKRYITPIGIVFVFVLLFIFVAPELVNKGLGYAHTKLNTPDWKVKKYKSFRLGLDLLGGTHLLYQADLSKVADKEDALEGIRDVIERRVNLFGVSEPVVQISGQDRLIVDLAGVRDVNEAIKLIGETPFLEFKTELPLEQGQAIVQRYLGVDADKVPVEALCNPANVQTLVLFVNQYREDPCYQPSGLSGRHLKSVEVVFEQGRLTPQVSLHLNDEGTKLLGQLTADNLGRRLAIYLDGAPISLPTIQAAITDGNAIITGNFSPQEARLLATRLNSGALPVPITLISQQTIGASLGSESLAKSLKAGIWGLIFVALFMILFYRLPGVISVFALFLYTLIVLTLYKIVPVTLTLAGIAGFILSLGMAVDANVLIFARMREELRAGKTLHNSIREGFSRAWLSVRDSHITTLLGALVLYIYTTSIVKGFALTLGIGVLTSLLTATVVTRTLLRLFTGPAFEKRKKLF